MDFHTEMPDMSPVDSDNELTVELVNSIAQNGGDNMTDDVAQIEAEMNEIFQQVMKYRKSAAELDMLGGMDTENTSDLKTATDDKKKRTMPKILLVLQSIAKTITDENKHDGLTRPKLLKVAKLIMDDAKKMTGKDNLDDPVLVAKYKELTKNPSSYVKTVKDLPPKVKEQAGGANADDFDIDLSEAPMRMGLF